ncbi:MAG: hypothetical protein E5W13_00495 [Mesorhizobium sp.]|nr:MAG: hypothetical protein E5W13_00495 [Mesorhizobium sp.]
MSDETGASEAFDVASAGLRSIFPATRDESLAFVTNFADELPPELSRQIPHWAERAIIRLEDIDVSHGIGFIHKALSWFDAEPLSALRPYLDALEMERRWISIWCCPNDCSLHCETIPLKWASKL